MSRVICTIYRSPKKEGTYLYLHKSRTLDCVPGGLLELFGEPQLVTTMLLTPERKLARADITKVLASLAKQGFYLQLPPAPEPYMQEINKLNDKLY